MKNFTISDSDLRSILHIEKETRSGQYIIDVCPFCGKEKHFYINKKTQLFDCKKCGVTGSIYKLLKHLDKTYLLGEKSVEFTEQIKSIRQSLQEELSTEQVVEELPKRNMPPGFRICIANKYLSSRGITRNDCKRYRIGETTVVFKYRKYILFPIYDGGDIRGFVGRYGNKVVPLDRLRYNNSLNTDFASLLYGYDEIVSGETETVIIVEGVFDKIAVDKKLGLWDDNSVKCVCTFGKKISNTQIQKLIAKNVTNIILSWDFDALREIKNYGMELDRYFNVKVAVSTHKKDIDECTQDEVIEVFSNVQPIRDFSVNIIGKLKR